MRLIRLIVDGKEHVINIEEEMPLLWVLRDELGIMGPKYGCGIARCGACTVHMDGEPTNGVAGRPIPVRSCSLQVGNVTGKITTIEGLRTPEGMHPVQTAWIENQVAQCGYCQSGQIMTAAYLLTQKPDPTDEDIDRAMSANLCRCGTYPRIRLAVKAAARKLREGKP
jgi:isoquinoline 1-oxidoreductase subunit alpha